MVKGKWKMRGKEGMRDKDYEEKKKKNNEIEKRKQKRKLN